jgi:hypothetical protein
MAASHTMMDYKGPVDYRTIDQLLKKLKKRDDFIFLGKTTSKRVYAVMVECLENIARHSSKTKPVNPRFEPSISISNHKDHILIDVKNPLRTDEASELISKLNQVNILDEKELNNLFENKINKDSQKDINGAGLGLMLMKLKSGNKIDYNITSIDKDLSYLELKISIKKYSMRKLFIENTPSSPKVILDPENNIFEISGESRPHDVPAFYNEIFRWLDDYSNHLARVDESKDPIIFNLDFEYFNSSSAKFILDFCKQIGNVRAKGNNIEVKWHYDDDDIDMMEAGKEMSRLAKVPFQYIQKDIK